MNIQDQVDGIKSREDLSKFVDEMRFSLSKGGKGWENTDLASYLEAMAAWISDMDGYFENIGEPCPEKPTWKTFAQILAAATIYE